MNVHKKIKNTKLIIIGSGPAGCTAAIYASRCNLKPILITGENKGGQLINTNNIENWPGDINNISGKDLMKRMIDHVSKYDTKIINDEILKVDFSKKPFILFGEKNIYYAKSVIIATGSYAKCLNIKSEKKFIGKGVSSCATCDGFFYKNKIVAVVGGGNTAFEESLYLSNIAKKVYLIHRNNFFKSEKILQNRVKLKINKKKIKLYKNYIVKKIIGNKNEGVTNIIIKSVNKKKIVNLKLQGIFIAIGHIPNTSIFINQIEFIKNSYIKTKSGIHGYHTETSIPGIFAAGDVSDHIYKQAITSASSGCMAALDAYKYISSLKNKKTKDKKNVKRK
ncbi:thioredoxin-disulfide reductase [Buchnera aphidicola (Taiwanaphis decaspermi)]|uniref:thioredoxin-disulfide reductase n=1 Tax=Buchnera aphidicola TaxID=9 RepID=UPI0031B87255